MKSVENLVMSLHNRCLGALVFRNFLLMNSCHLNAVTWSGCVAFVRNKLFISVLRLEASSTDPLSGCRSIIVVYLRAVCCEGGNLM